MVCVIERTFASLNLKNLVLHGMSGQHILCIGAARTYRWFASMSDQRPLTSLICFGLTTIDCMHLKFQRIIFTRLEGS